MEQTENSVCHACRSQSRSAKNGCQFQNERIFQILFILYLYKIHKQQTVRVKKTGKKFSQQDRDH
jgi:hypothetical protein